MPDTAEYRARRKQGTLAQKLQWLRELKTPNGEQPPSYDMTARQVSQETGVSISGPCFWELATGRTTNPKLHHLQALARYFKVPVPYLADEEADFEQLDAELELLQALKQRGVRSIKLMGVTNAPADLPVIQNLLGRLRMLDGLADEEERETALRLATLSTSQRQALRQAVDGVDLMRALQDEKVRELIRLAARLRSDSLHTAAITLNQPAVLEALEKKAVRDIAVAASELSEASQRAVLSMIEHLHRVEDSLPSDR
ncbi:hypothetical protein [Streptomyces sp. NBC_01803]|uniref:hypothetical protein n=1 Tax=Streptomyces sp. NBC_01803 TaxID=2975946 RepID=UPI002DDC848D|nr:hypothetical protein [Streptomyces sp. NBC_01803]WSA46444.1 hypothetical protein OIE51_21010 [Streptomyces sp. NBC_01803]